MGPRRRLGSSSAAAERASRLRQPSASRTASTTVSRAASSIVGLSGSAQWRSAASSARGRSPLGTAARYSVKVCSAGYHVVWMPARFERFAEAVAGRAVAQQDGEGEVRGALDRSLVERELEARQLQQPLAVGADERPAGADRLLEAADPAEAERGARLVEAVVEADVDDVVGGVVSAVAVPGAARHRVRAQQPHALGAARRRRWRPCRPRPRRAASWRRS